MQQIPRNNKRKYITKSPESFLNYQGFFNYRIFAIYHQTGDLDLFA
jgi:hypothetical protein